MTGTALKMQNRFNTSSCIPLPVRCLATSFFCLCLIDLTLILANACFAQQAYAATWPLDGSQDSVITRFHEVYSYQGKELRHCGIDILANQGDSVAAPLSGTVSFVGSVPSGDAYLQEKGTGETMLAASITLDDGRTLTLMPLSSVAVDKGERVSEGAKIGILAKEGDRSCSATHLHIGLKRDGSYFDPLSLFPGLFAQSSQAATKEVECVKPGASSEAFPASSEMAQLPENVEAAQPVAEPVQESVGCISSGSVEWECVSERTPNDASAGIGMVASGIWRACVAQAEGLLVCVGAVSKALGVPAFAISTALFAAATLVTALFIRILILVLTRVRKGDFEGRKKLVLCPFWGGGIMHKLFPAPGTSFITRGR